MVLYYYHFDIINAVIDFQLIEFNEIFLESSMELITLSVALSPVDGFKSFSISAICSLGEQFYHQDFIKKKDIWRDN